MRYRLAAIILGPVLLAQGLYVRRVTRQIPEPIGPRQGAQGTGKPLRLLIAGDSSAAGVGADTQASALSGQLVSALANHFSVAWKLMARTGHAVQDTLTELEAASRCPYDIAVVAVGVNDVTRGTAPNTWLGLIVRVIDLLRSKFGVQHILLSAIPPMHAFPALPMPLGWFLGKRAATLNDLLRDWTIKTGHSEFVQPAFPLEPRLMAADGFHPGPEAYAIWAAHLDELIRRRWQSHAFISQGVATSE